MIIISAQAFLPRTGGIQNLMGGLAEHIAWAGHEVLVLADGDSKDAATDPARPYRVERFAGPRPLRRWRKARRLKQLVRKGGVDAVYLDTWKSMEPLISANLPCPLVIYGHGNEFLDTPSKRVRIRKALAAATALICVSRETVGRVTPALPDGMRVEIIHPPVYPHPPATAQDETWAQDMWGTSSPRLVVLARLIDWKGIDQAIRAAAALRTGFPDIKLAIAGIGDDRERLEKIADEINAPVQFLGRVEEGGQKTALLSSADLFLQPGRQVIQEREGFGITYLEAALVGLPAISGNAGGAPEAIVSGQTGFVVDGTDTSAVTDAARRILSDEATRERFAAAARAHGDAALWKKQVVTILAVAGLEPKNS